jgi:hypothetical protein
VILLERPTDRCVVANAIPMDRTNTTGAPRLGSRNHLVEFMKTNKRAVNKLATKNVTQKILRRIPIIEAQKKPEVIAINMIVFVPIFATDRKLLNSIARNCFRRTATQKIGSE